VPNGLQEPGWGHLLHSSAAAAFAGGSGVAGRRSSIQLQYCHDPHLRMPATAGPVYAEFNTALSEIVVADYVGGTISVIDVSLDEYGNDSATFGPPIRFQWDKLRRRIQPA